MVPSILIWYLNGPLCFQRYQNSPNFISTFLFINNTYSETRYTMHNPLKSHYNTQCIIPTLLYQHFYHNTFQDVWSFFNLAEATSKGPHSHTNLSSTMQSILCSTFPTSSSSIAESLSFFSISKVSIFFHHSHQTQPTQRNHILHYNDSCCIPELAPLVGYAQNCPFTATIGKG